jgi:hypothetical protein
MTRQTTATDAAPVLVHHRLAAGHFTPEDSLDGIAEGIHRFYLSTLREEQR